MTLVGMLAYTFAPRLRKQKHTNAKKKGHRATKQLVLDAHVALC